MTAVVSIIVPAHNAERYIEQTLKSVQAQTFRAWECIVVDDGSTDATREIVERLCLEDGRVSYFFQPNRGLSAARNAGLARARGAYIQFLDADDLIDPNKLDVQVPIMDNDNTLGVSYTNYRPFDGETGALQERFWPDMLGSNPVEDFLFRWERGLSIPIHAGLFRRSLWSGRQAFDELFRAKEDWLMWIDLALRGVRFEFIDRELALYRQHPGSLRNDPSMGLVFLRAAFSMLKRIPNSMRERFLTETLDHILAKTPDEQIRRLETERRLAIEDLARLQAVFSEAARPEDSSSVRGSVEAGCTIISRNYLSHARILAHSFLEHHPRSRFFVLVVDGLPEGEHAGPGVRIIAPEELAIPYLSELVVKYELIELCTALKPSLLRFLLAECGMESVVYIDPDIMVFRPFNELVSALATADIVVTPHFSSPIPLDGNRPTELDILVSGIFNLGFLGVRQSVETHRFLNWWTDRLRDGCHLNATVGQFVDQKWMDFAPLYFESTGILRDETYNVAYWNLHSRRLERQRGHFVVNGRPLTFFHFSGIDLANVRFRDTHQNRFIITPGSALAELVDLYRDLQQKNGYETCRTWGYGLSQFDNGQPFHRILRELCAGLSVEARERFGDVTKTKDETSFFRWALTSDPSCGGLSPFLKQLYSMRKDVAAAYPDVTGMDREAFLKWARSHGAREMGYDPALV